MSTRTVRLGIAGAGFMGLRTYVDAIRGAKHVLSENGVKVVLGSHYVRDRAKHPGRSVVGVRRLLLTT